MCDTMVREPRRSHIRRTRRPSASVSAVHESSHATMRAFVRVHLAGARGRPLEVLDFGSQMVDDQPLSYADLFDDPAWNYRGLDIEAGKNVDVIVADAYDWSEVESDSVDLVISGQALEHVEYFWASVFEVVRVLRPGGLAAIIAPSGGFEHRYPLDCWRFYPDGFSALIRYVGGDEIDVFTDWQHGEWDDSILVMRKPDWDDEQRLHFARRAAMQRALLSGADEPDDVGPPAPAEHSSILAGVQEGALTAELEAMRERRQAAEARAVAAREAAAEAELEARIVTEGERLAAERIEGMAAMRAYGKVRGTAARAAGERGRRAYRKLRKRD